MISSTGHVRVIPTVRVLLFMCAVESKLYYYSALSTLEFPFVVVRIVERSGYLRVSLFY